MVVRAYTPVSSEDDRGFVDLIIKVSGAHPVQLLHPHTPIKLKVVGWRRDTYPGKGFPEGSFNCAVDDLVKSSGVLRATVNTKFFLQWQMEF